MSAVLLRYIISWVKPGARPKPKPKPATAGTAERADMCSTCGNLPLARSSSMQAPSGCASHLQLQGNAPHGPPLDALHQVLQAHKKRGSASCTYSAVGWFSMRILALLPSKVSLTLAAWLCQPAQSACCSACEVLFC